MSLAAKRARLIVDPVADTFSFELADAVYTRVPEPGEPGPEHFLIAAERQVLGPVPWGADIVVE